MEALGSMLHDAYRWTRRRAGSIAFEHRYGVRTGGRIDLDEFGLEGQDRGYYIASNWRNLRRVLRNQPVSRADVFLDLGSGMGRMVLEAARFPFGRVIGVELAEGLHRIAEENLRSYRGPMRCRNVELVHSDVLDYRIPDDVTMVYMFSPFGGKVFGAVVEKLKASLDEHPRTLTIVYAHPVEEAQLLATGRVRKIDEITVGRGKQTIARTIRTYIMT